MLAVHSQGVRIKGRVLYSLHDVSQSIANEMVWVIECTVESTFKFAAISKLAKAKVSKNLIILYICGLAINSLTASTWC